MARRKGGAVFTEAAGKTVQSIRYEENSEWQALEVAFSDGTLLSFEFSSRVVVKASYLNGRRGDLESIRKYGRVSGDSGHEA
jgi:hypothetical protein